MRALKRIPHRALVEALVIAILVSSVIWFIFAHRPVEYSARVALLASPAQISSNTDFGAVVAQSMAAINVVAHSPSVLSKASAAVNGAPSAHDLFDAVSVELVPGSGLARLSVRASSREIARDLAVTIAKEIVGKGLISPVGVLRLLDEQPDVSKVAPDETLAAGFAVAAGVVAAVAGLGLAALLRPSKRQQIERALTSAGVSRAVAIVEDGGLADIVDRIQLLSTASARPVRVVALTPSSSAEADKLSRELTSAGIRVSDGEDHPQASVVGVAAGNGAANVRSVVAALPEPSQLIAVVLK